MSIWKTIETTLKDEIRQGHYGPGDKLATEAALAARFGVNRHTVRRALAELAAQDLVISRRGAGVFVQHAPTDYPIGARVRFHQNLKAAGKIPGKQMLAFETRRANAQEAQALKLDEGASVHVYDGLSLSDGHPIAVFRSVFPADRFPEMQTGTERYELGHSGARPSRGCGLHPRGDPSVGPILPRHRSASSWPARRGSGALFRGHQCGWRWHPGRAWLDLVRWGPRHADA